MTANLNLNNANLPAPNLVEGNNKAQKEEVKEAPKRKFNIPKVGVVSAPDISQTPVSDVLELKKKQNPKMAYKLTPKKLKIALFNYSSALVFVLGLVAGIKEFIKFKR